MRRWSLVASICLGLFTSIVCQYTLETAALGAVAQEDTKKPTAATDTKTAEPKTAEPKTAEPKATEANATEPKATEPKATRSTTPRTTTPKTQKPSASALPVPPRPARAVLPETPAQEELKKEEVKDGLPPTAQKIVDVHRE